MAELTRPTYAVNNIQGLADLTKDQATAVKVLHDKTGKDTKDYLTEVLLPELDMALGLPGGFPAHLTEYASLEQFPMIAPETDDTDRINRAIIATPNGGRLWVPVGTYNISSISISKSIAIISNGAVFKQTASSTGNAIVIQDTSNILIQGLTIDGNKTNTVNQNSDAAQNGIRVVRTTGTMGNITLREIKIKDTWRSGICVIGTSGDFNLSDITIEKVTVNNNYMGIFGRYVSGINVQNCDVSGSHTWDGIQFIECQNVNIRANKSHSNKRHGITIDLTEYAIIENNLCFLNGDGQLTTWEAWGIVISRECAFFAVSNNVCYNDNWGGITCDVTTEALAKWECYGVIQGNSCSGGQQKHGIYVNHAIHLNVIGNNCYDNKMMGILISQSESISINGNACNKNLDTGIWVDTLCISVDITGNVSCRNTNDGIYTNDLKSGVISSNTCNLNGKHGIHLNASVDCNICNNVSKENSQNTNPWYYNIWLTNSSNYNSVSGNVVRQGAQSLKPQYGIYISNSSTGNLINNNDAYDGGATNGISDAGTSTTFGSGNRNKNGTYSTTPN